MKTANVRNWQPYTPQKNEDKYYHPRSGAYGRPNYASRQDEDGTRPRSCPVASPRSLILPHTDEAGKPALPDSALDSPLGQAASQNPTMSLLMRPLQVIHTTSVISTSRAKSDSNCQSQQMPVVQP